MSVIRVNKTADYTVMSNYCFKEKDMSLKAKGLLSLMLSLPEDWDYSIGGLAAICKESDETIKNILNELKKFKYLKIIKKMPGETESGRIEYEYNIYECPQTDEMTIKQEVKKQEVKKQGVEKQGVEKQGVVFDPLNKYTNKLNTKDKININKKEKYENILSQIENDELRELYLEYIEMRKNIKSPMTERALKILIGRVDNLEKDVERKKKLLEVAILNNWKSVYPLKEDDKVVCNENNKYAGVMDSIRAKRRNRL